MKLVLPTTARSIPLTSELWKKKKKSIIIFLVLDLVQEEKLPTQNVSKSECKKIVFRKLE